MNYATDSRNENALLWLCLHYSPKQINTSNKEFKPDYTKLKGKHEKILYLGNTLVGTFNQNNINDIECLAKEVKASLDYQLLYDSKTFIMRISDQKELRTIHRWFLSKSKKLTR